MKKKRRILYLTTEIAPFNPESPLAEMSRHLPRVYRTMGHDIRVVMPKYNFIRDRNYNLREVIRLREIPVPLAGKLIWVSVKSGFIPDTRVQVYFLEDEKYFSRNGVFNDPDTGEPYEDNDERFIVFVRATVVMLKILSWQPQIIHCSDWTGGRLSYYLRKLYHEDPFYQSSKVVLTLAHYDETGSFPPTVAFKAGINPDEFTSGCDPELEGKFSFLKAGIINADRVVVNGPVSVSEFPEPFGAWFDEYSREHPEIINRINFGIDNHIWNPDKDDKIFAHFSHRDLSGKMVNKSKLAEKYSLKVAENAPLVGCIWNGGDFSPLKKAVKLVKESGGALVIADKSASDDDISAFQETAPGHIGAVKLLTGLTLKQLLAGLDILILSPDKHKELLHLKAMKYGAVPVVPRIGFFGDDVLEDPKQGLGFVYDDNQEKPLSDALARALELFKDDKSWSALTKRVMKNDPNWNKIAKAYLEVYD